MSEPHRTPAGEPIFNVPGVILGLSAVLAAVHALRTMAPESLISAATVDTWTVALAFIPARLRSTVGIPGGDLATWTSFLTHSLVHVDLMHLVINGAMLLAFGSALARRVGAVRMLVLYVLAAIAGALLYYAANGPANVIMIGASGAVSGLVGAAFRFFFRALDSARFDPEGLAGAARWVPPMTLSEMWSDRRPRNAVLSWLAVNLVLAMIAPWLGYEGGIAWEAHLGGFLVGLFAMDAIDRYQPRPLAHAVEFDRVNPNGS